MLVMDREIRKDTDTIVKYHITQPAFNIGDVAKVKVAMKNNTKLVTFSYHCEERIKEKGILPERESYVVSSTLKPEDVIGATVVPDLRAVLNQYHEY